MNLRAAFQPLTQVKVTEVTSGGGFFGGFFGGVSTKNGTPVNTSTALGLSAFFNGIEIIGNDYAKLPKSVFKKTKAGDLDKIEKVKDHPASKLLKRPNQYMTPFMYDKVLVQTAILKGNSYAEIERNPTTGTPIAKQIIDQDKTPVRVVESGGKLYYKFGGRTLPSTDIIHIPGFSFNGMTGIGVVAMAAKSLGVSLESQEYALEYYASKGVGTAVVTSAKEINQDAKNRYADALTTRLSSNAAWKVAVLDQMGSFNHIKMTPQEALFLETNKQGIEEVARWLNLSTIKLKSLSNANNSISQEQKIQHVEDSILPWVIRCEQESDRKLFTEKEQESHYHKANINALMRADLKTKALYYTSMVYAGIYDRNEVRELEEKNPKEGLSENLTPVNMQTMEQIQKGLKDE